MRSVSTLKITNTTRTANKSSSEKTLTATNALDLNLLVLLSARYALRVSSLVPIRVGANTFFRMAALVISVCLYDALKVNE